MGWKTSIFIAVTFAALVMAIVLVDANHAAYLESLAV